jgi:hypothetical protein
MLIFLCGHVKKNSPYINTDDCKLQLGLNISLIMKKKSQYKDKLNYKIKKEVLSEVRVNNL